MKYIYLLLHLIACTGNAQTTTFKSLLSEYAYPSNNNTASEWLKRDIVFTPEMIRIISYGKNGTDVQSWAIQSKEENIGTHSSNVIYYTHLASGED